MRDSFKLLLLIIPIFISCINPNKSNNSNRQICVDSVYYVDEDIQGFKVGKSYCFDSIFYALQDLTKLDSFNFWKYRNLISLFDDSCNISFERMIIGKIENIEIQEIIYTIDSCLNVNTLYRCDNEKCPQILCVVAKIDSNEYKPIIFNQLRYDEYPDTVKIFENNRKRILSVCSSISGNTGETKEYYFIAHNDTLMLFEPWKNLNLNEIDLPDSTCFKLQGSFNVKTLTYTNSLWHTNDHQHWPTLGRIEIYYEVVGINLKLKNYKIFEPTEEQIYWIDRREK